MKILDILSLPLPKKTAKSVREVDYERIIDKGYDTVLFDYDNTIASWRSPFDMRNRPVIEMLLTRGIKVAVVTNAPVKRVRHLYEIFGDDVSVYHSMRKPGTKQLRRVLSEMRSVPEKTAIVGDLFLTDVIAGNRMGMYTIMVRPSFEKEVALYKRLAGWAIIALYMVFFYTIGWFFRLIDLATPHVFVESVEQIDFSKLKLAGYELVIFDFDNTLEPWRSHQLSLRTLSVLKQARDSGLKIALVSNGKNDRLDSIRESIGSVPVIGRAFKPSPRRSRRFVKETGVANHRVVVIGDQLFTDVLMGNLIGAYTIKTVPISEEEFFWTRMIRKVERLTIALLKSKGEVERV